MKTTSALLFIIAFVSLAFNPTAEADILSDWGTTADTYISQHTPGHFQYWRGGAMVAVAMFEGANAAIGGYTPYALDVSAPGASAEAAVSQAAYTVLTYLSPEGQSTLNTTLAASLASVPDGPAKDAGIRIGQFAGEAVIRLRAGDNPALRVPSPSVPAEIGQWRPTPPNHAAAVGMQGRYLTPWTMRSPAQFRPGPPPALTSEIYTADYNEIRVLGSRGNANRTPNKPPAPKFGRKAKNG